MSNAPRILVVDDETPNRTLVTRVLTGAGYVVFSAPSGAKALELLSQQGPFDAYILDVMMPKMRGTELAAIIRDSQPDARILFFTGYSAELFSGDAVIASRESLLTKPVTVGDLRDAVSKLLAK